MTHLDDGQGIPNYQNIEGNPQRPAHEVCLYYTVALDRAPVEVLESYDKHHHDEYTLVAGISDINQNHQPLILLSHRILENWHPIEGLIFDFDIQDINQNPLLKYLLTRHEQTQDGETISVMENEQDKDSEYSDQ